MEENKNNPQVTFRLLQNTDFELLLRWLKAPHVQKWYDKDIEHNLDSVVAKFDNYVKGFRVIANGKLPVSSYICYMDNQPIGYFQLYSASYSEDFPEDMGQLDFFIGEKNYLGRGLGSFILKEFLKKVAYLKFKWILVDPEIENQVAIRCYEKAGFVVIKKDRNLFWMIASSHAIRLSVKNLLILEKAFKKFFLKKDKIFVFGSRVDLLALGGDLDLYIETYADTVDRAMNMKAVFVEYLIKNGLDFKIDIILNVLILKNFLPIYEVAKKQGVLFYEKS